MTRARLDHALLVTLAAAFLLLAADMIAPEPVAQLSSAAFYQEP